MVSLRLFGVDIPIIDDKVFSDDPQFLNSSSLVTPNPNIPSSSVTTGFLDQETLINQDSDNKNITQNPEHDLLGNVEGMCFWAQESGQEFVNRVSEVSSNISLSLGVSFPGSTHGKVQTPRKRKEKEVAIDDDGGTNQNQKRKPVKRVKHVDDQTPSEPIPGLLQMIEKDGGTHPFFLYRKTLEESDVKKDQNRLFVNKSEKMMEFLTEDERAEVIAVDDKGKVKGVDASTLDPQGEHHKLRISSWRSLGVLVLNGGWTGLVRANNVQKEDIAEIWGYRVGNGLRLAVSFRKPEVAGSPSGGVQGGVAVAAAAEAATGA